MNNKQKIQKFNALGVTSKYGICGLPLRMDSYATCNFACKYCFANCRTFMACKAFKVANVQQFTQTLDRVLDQGNIREGNYADMLLADGYTIHLGGMSDPFQPCEEELKITEQLIDIINRFNRHIVISTKSNTCYGANLRPDLHAIQLSVSNVYDRTDIEPNVPPIAQRLAFFHALKSAGFRVGIRIQPFIPGISDLEIVKLFSGADHYQLEGIKLVPQDRKGVGEILRLTGLHREDFICLGLMNLRPEIRWGLYQPFIEYFESQNLSYSLADNDFHPYGNNICCCGDALVHKATPYNTTALSHKYGTNYRLEDALHELYACGHADCNCAHCHASNRTKGFQTVSESFRVHFGCRRSPMSPKFFWESSKR